jgi:lipopolysaccharide transport system permease protein
MNEQPVQGYRIIQPGDDTLLLYLSKVFRHRGLLFRFLVRDVKEKYAQTYLGLLWSGIQALAGIGLISFFFGFLLKIDTGSVPYPLYAFPGMISWYYFSFIIGYSGSSLVQSQHIIKKTGFPKLIIPLSRALVGLVDLAIWMALLILLMIIYRYPFSGNLVFMPFFILLNLVTSLSIAIWLSALTVRYRDLLIFIPYLIGFGIFVTPVFFPETLVPEKYDWILYLNPMAGVISGLRWSVLSTPLPSAGYLLGFLPVILLLVSGLFYFKQIEGKIADTI